MKKTLLFFGLLLLSFGPIRAQKTVGVISSIDSLVQPGYNLFYPSGQPHAYLMDNCGRLINTWENPAGLDPGNAVELLPNGDVILAYRPTDVSGDVIWAGGGGMYIARRDWDNNTIWEYELNDSTGRIHHDFAVMPNGNVLTIAWGRVLLADMVAAGRDTSLFTAGEVWPDRVLELQPDGSGGATVVWEWNSWDHLIQDHDATKANYGVVADHPELIDLNYDDFGGNERDWHHVNAIDYNASLDQIVLSVPSFNEVWIIDHSTSTAEAAGHSGGNSGKGGDLLFRWGNPEAYDMGDSTDVKLGFQHDIHWVDDHLDSSAPDFGKLAVFNNRAGADFSSGNFIAQVWDAGSQSYAMSGGVFLPTDFDWTYVGTPPQSFYSPIVSGLQRLPNGNTLICAGQQGYSREVTPGGQIVWEYVQPLVNGIGTNQGDSVSGPNLIFRMNRYMPDFPAFAGRTLVAGDYLEGNPDTAACSLPVVGAPEPIERSLSFYPNPSSGVLYLNRETARPARLEVYDLAGHRLLETQVSGFNPKVDLNALQRGLYLMRLDGTATGKVMVSE